MTTPTRWQELSAVILDRFQGIQVADGYQTNLGLRVAESRTAPLAEDETEFLNVRFFPGVVEDTIGEDHNRLRVVCEIVVAGEDADQRIWTYLADLTKAIGVDLTWNALADHTEHGEISELALEHAGRKVAALSKEFIVHFSSARWSAYVP